MVKLKKMNWLIIPCIALVIVIGSVSSCSSDKTTKNDSMVLSENTEIAKTDPEIEAKDSTENDNDYFMIQKITTNMYPEWYEKDYLKKPESLVEKWLNPHNPRFPPR